MLFRSVQLLSATDIYYVQFSDKVGSPYSVSNPLDFLSQRAIDRRATWNIAIDSTDFPVNPAYVAALRSAGAVVKHTSRWMNSALVVTSDDDVIDSIYKLPFVIDIELVYRQRFYSPKEEQRQKTEDNSNDYGDANTQLQMIGVDRLHAAGFRGANIHVAVIDAGFLNVNTNRAFDSLRMRNGILGSYDFVNDNSDIYQEDFHGAAVLATMAANIPNQYLGGAPDASYWLLRSEDAYTEWPVEADYWIIAAEFADSVGVDIINTSLGYAMFDDPSLDYRYNDLNGKNLRVSQAALMTARKGIITLVSAGNEGNTEWGTISAPADADSILTVGAVDRYGNVTGFSSYGPSADRRVKPDICTVGGSAAIVDSYGYPSISNGTSFSSPIAAAMMACLKQARPDLHPQQLMEEVRKSASHYSTPDNYFGYGIPNAWRVYSDVVGYEEPSSELGWNVYPNPVEKELYIETKTAVKVRLHDLCGRQKLQRQLSGYGSIDMSALINGIYFLTIDNGSKVQTYKIIKGEF